MDSRADHGKRVDEPRVIPESIISVRVVELTQEVSAKASQRFQDLELARRSQAGDTEAFDELVTKYRNRIFAIVCCMVRNGDEAWDLAQEAFLKAWKSIHRFECRSSFYTWLYRITVNLTICSFRRKDGHEEVELNEAIPSSLPSPSVNYQCTQIREQLNEALARLSLEQRAVVVLREGRGPAISRNCGDPRSFYRHSDVQTFLRQEKATVYVEACLQRTLRGSVTGVCSKDLA